MTVPIGIVAIWTGTLVSIPANWALCDGNGGRPNLLAKFIRGTSGDAGGTGGSDTAHGHTSSAVGDHSHTLNTITNHDHSSCSTSIPSTHTHSAFQTVLSGSSNIAAASVGSHSDHAYGSSTGTDATHGHTLGSSGGHSHTYDSSTELPPYYQVAYIQAGASATISSGIIIIWTGSLASIPSGWALCDGNSGRPELRSKFIRGVPNGSTDPGGTGGGTTHGHTCPSLGHDHSGGGDVGSNHSHSADAISWAHEHNTGLGDSSGSDGIYSTSTTPSPSTHTHTVSTGSGGHSHSMGYSYHSHTVDAASNLPEYYTVAFIASTGATDLPVNGIIIWTSTVASIPVGCYVCDGTSGRPNLVNKFIYGAAVGNEPGGTGGNANHSHSCQYSGSHSDHSQSAAGGHGHTTESGGSHTHSFAFRSTYRADPPNQETCYNVSSSTDTSHYHTLTAVAGHTHSGMGDPGSHYHSSTNSVSNYPAYFSTLFIRYEYTLVTKVQDNETEGLSDLSPVRHAHAVRLASGSKGYP